MHKGTFQICDPDIDCQKSGETEVRRVKIIKPTGSSLQTFEPFRQENGKYHIFGSYGLTIPPSSRDTI